MDSALHEWRALLGDRVTTEVEPYTRNLTEFPDRKIHSVLRPVSRDEVRRIVAVAARHRVPLYPVSTGRNWGLGSRLPVLDGCAIVDLGLMNRILEIDTELRYAVVEPGVTQRQLADALADGPCMLNVTGSSAHTSVVGNLLDRGVGVLGPRVPRGLEAVLATGEVVRTGHWDTDGTPGWHHHPPGAGPDVTGLFVQSGFGIVTAAVVDLHPRQHVELALVGTPDAELARHVDVFRELRESWLLRDRIEVNAVDDPRLTGLSPRASAWLTWVALWGDAIGVLKEKLSASFPDVTYYTAAEQAPEPVRTRFRKLAGEPGDEYVDAMAGRPVGSPALDDDLSFPGFVCVLPAVPFRGRHVRAAVSLARDVDAEVGVRSHLTFNSVSEHCLEGFLRVRFDRRATGEVAAAHRWAATAQDRLAANGFRPTRTSVETMSYPSGHTAFAAALKEAADPHDLISPGRYLPARSEQPRPLNRKAVSPQSTLD